ncbi:DUF1003 domain-containing protein [Jatrophihabitans sp. DSM 45814]
MADRRPRLDQPNLPRRGVRVSYDPEAFGRLTERIARFLGTGRYLVAQSFIILVWLVSNLVPGLPHFDPYPLGFLTLILSLQAAYAAPLILLAQNRQDDRDRVNLEEDRDQARKATADAEYLAREIASIRIALGEVATRDFLRSELSRLERIEDRDAQRDREKVKEKAAKDKAREKERSQAKKAAAEASSAAATSEPETSAPETSAPEPDPQADPTANEPTPTERQD